MSDEDMDLMVVNGQGHARVDRDRRAPRFSWTPAYEATFFSSLCDSVALGLRENSSFKAEAWERAALALQENHNAYPSKNHLINKSDNARKRFRLWRGLRENPDFTYNAIARTVIASEDAWNAHIEREPLARALRGRPFEHEDYMEVLYPDVVGSGGAPKRVMKPRRRGDGQMSEDIEMPGTGILDLQHPDTHQLGLTSDTMSRPSLSNTPSSSTSSSQHASPSRSFAPRSVVGNNGCALTPPDETISSFGRKQHMNPLLDTQAAFGPPPVSIPTPRMQTADKRRRTSLRSAVITGKTNNGLLSPAPTMMNRSVSGTTTAPTMVALDQTIMDNRPLLEELVDSLKSREVPRWRQDALDIFFRDFGCEDLDLQVKISENILTNENKAMVFCKMPIHVRQHWVGRLREMHHKAT